MPANLTPQYLAAEKHYKDASTDHERLRALKEMLAMIPKHKGTDKLQADIKRRMAKIKEGIEKGGGSGKHPFRYHVDKEGLPQIALVGLPNVGKSQLLAQLTHATPEIAEYPFTTRMFLPGIMDYQNFHIQLVDLPALAAEHLEFWVPEMIKNADAVLLIIDLSLSDPLEQLETSFSLLRENRILMIDQALEHDPYQPEFYLKGMIIGNKSDHPAAPDNWQVLQELFGEKYLMCPISARSGSNLNELRRMCVVLLDIIRVYSKPPGKEPNRSLPFIFKRGSTLLDFANTIHHDFARKLKFARVWGATKFNGQRVKIDYVLTDEDVIELHL
jgi:ribosome-interacting GTPase 1